MANLRTKSQKSFQKVGVPIIAAIVVVCIAVIIYAFNVADSKNFAKVPFKQEELLPVLKKENSKINNVVIESEKGIAGIYINVDKSGTDEKSLIAQTAKDNILLIEKLMDQPDVKTVIITVLKETGQSNEDKRSVQFTFNKAQNIDFKNLNKTLKEEYHTFYNSASQYYISGEIWRSLSQVEKEKFSNKNRIK